MLTAQQLYEIIAHKDDPDAETGEQPRKKAAKALYFLTEHYKEHPAAYSDTGELLFSVALSRMVVKAERVIRNGAKGEGFKELLKHELGEFNATYGKLAKEVREQGPVREAFDVILPEENPDKLAYEGEVQRLTQELVREHEAHMRFKSDSHPAQIGPEPKTPEELETMKKENEERIEYVFAALLAMDDLRKSSGWKSALDPDVRKTATEKMRVSPVFSMALGGVKEVARDPEGVADMFRRMGRTELQAQVAPAAKAVEAWKQKEATVVYERDSRMLAEETLRAFKAVRQLIQGRHPANRDKNMSLEDLEDLLAKNKENLRTCIVTLTAMDNLRRAGDYVSATDPQKLEEATDRLMQEKAESFDIVVQALSSKAGEQDLSILFRDPMVNKPELADLVADAEKSVEQKTKAAFDEDYEALAKQTVRLKENLDQLREGDPEAQQNGKAYTEKLEDLKLNLASLIAMDNFRRKGRYEVLSDPRRLKAETDKIMRSKSMETALASLAPAKGVGKSLEEVTRGILKRGTLSKTLAALGGGIPRQPGSTEKKKPETEATGQEKPQKAPQTTEPEKTGTMPRRESAPVGTIRPSKLKLSTDSPLLRFQAKLEELRESLKTEKESILYELDTAQCRRDLRYLFALRDMGKTDPYTPVTDDQVKARAKEMYAAKDDPEYQLYQKVDSRIKNGSISTFRAVVGAIKGNEKGEEFASVVSKAANIKLEAPTAEKQVGPTMK